MYSGKLRTPLTLWTITKATDEYGDVLETPVSSGTVWAALSTVSGTESLNTDIVNPASVVNIVCRYQSNITNESWFMYGSRRFNITYVANVDERNRELHIQAIEVK